MISNAYIFFRSMPFILLGPFNNLTSVLLNGPAKMTPVFQSDLKTTVHPESKS
jgi:hypothetical protein